MSLKKHHYALLALALLAIATALIIVFFGHAGAQCAPNDLTCMSMP